MEKSNKINFTESAKKEIERIISEKDNKSFFRISVQGGGCSGFKYSFSFEKNPKSNDKIFDKTLIDKNSLKIIEGSTVDFKKRINRKFFCYPKSTSKFVLWLRLVIFCLMKIVSWNVNSVRARISNVKDYLKLSKPDLIMLQEIKTEEKISLSKISKKLVTPPLFLDKSHIMVSLLLQKKKFKIRKKTF